MTAPVILTDPVRKRLLYRAMHRGFKEADIILGSFAEEHLPTMTEAEVGLFTALLEVPDQELYGWIIGRAEAPANYRNEVLEMLRNHPVAEAVRARAGGSGSGR